MTVVVRHPDDDELIRVYVKGAAEMVIKFCSKTINTEGEVVVLSEEDTNRVIDDVLENGFAA